MQGLSVEGEPEMTKSEYGLDESDALRALLEDMAANYVDPSDLDLPAGWDEERFYEEFEVRFTDDTPHASGSLDDPWVAVSTDTGSYRASGAKALRCIVDTLSHECEHIRKSDLGGKREFMEEYDDGYARLAGMVLNVLEDQYIDRTRTLRFRGLKKTHAWKIRQMMESDEYRQPMGDLDGPGRQAMEGFIQLAHAGTVKGFEDAEPEVQKALTAARPLVYRVRFTDDQDARVDISREVMDLLVDVVPKRPDMPEWLQDLIRELMDELETHMDESEVPDDADFDPDDAEVDEDGEPVDEETDGEGNGGAGEEGSEDGEGGEEMEEVDAAGSGESGEDGDGSDGSGAGGGDDGGEDSSGPTRNRRLVELTEGRDDASHVRIE